MWRYSSCANSARMARRCPIMKSSSMDSLRATRCLTASAAPRARVSLKRLTVLQSASCGELAEFCTVVLCREVELRAHRHNAGRVHLALTAVIVPLDLRQADGLGHARHLVCLLYT